MWWGDEGSEVDIGQTDPEEDVITDWLFLRAMENP